MTAVVVEITRIVDDAFTGFVECFLVGAGLQAHTFVEKIPVVQSVPLRFDSVFPCSGTIRCRVESEFSDEAGRLLVRINTEHPDGVESTAGERRFVVLSSQVVS